MDRFYISADLRPRLRTPSGPISSSPRLNVCSSSNCHGRTLSVNTGLVVYHCTFLSLRSHDSSRHIRNDVDHDIAEEELYFSGSVSYPKITRYGLLTDQYSTIRDSGYKHALRVYRDRSTDALRLEASVKEGEMAEYAHSHLCLVHC